jgi:ferric-dicitrate binding protein FerR (iron transport regulator)
LSDSESRELEDLLSGDLAAQESFLDYFHLDAELRMIVNSQQALQTARQRIEAMENAPQNESWKSTSRQWASEQAAEDLQRGARRHWARWFSVAVAFSLLIAVGWFAATQRWLRPPEAEYAAVLKAASDCRWESERLSVGDRLRSGQTLRLKSGVAEIHFASGAIVTLNGPARLQLESASKADLQVGMLSAMVPPKAIGFTISAPGLKVVDLGTRFGVKAATGGKTEVHVFRGRVQASLLDEQGGSLQTLTLNKSEAAVVEPVKLTISPSKAALDQFMFDDALKQDQGETIVVAINGGNSWDGWYLQGASNQVGIYGSGATDDVYKIYTTVFAFDDHAVSGKPVGSAGFAPGAKSAGAFANGNTILGIGIERISGSPIATPTVKFDLGNDSYAAASSVGGADGKTNISAAHAGDYNTQYNYDPGNTWKTETLVVFDGQGKSDELAGGLVAYDYAFRAFAVIDPASNQTVSYQLFFDLDAMDALYGRGNPGVGIGTFGKELTFAINALGSNHVVIQRLSILPRDVGTNDKNPK